LEEKYPMETRQAGITALITAYSRAYHATHDSLKIFDDFLADAMFTAEEHINFDRNLAGLVQMIDPALAATHPDQETALARVMQIHNGPISLSRSRYCEDCLDLALAAGVQQYVILGAGMDTFAFRRPDLQDRLQVYAVDHPVTQALMQQRITLAGWQVPTNLHFIPIDFAQDRLGVALRGSSFAAEKRTFISWLGVTYYLERGVIFDTLHELADLTPPGSHLVFDYLDSDAFLAGKSGSRVLLMQAIARQVGEPMKTGFDPRTLSADLDEKGFHLQENLSPEEIQAHFFQRRTDSYHAFEHIHFARAVRSD
jgi:methyltransferase (TIGR00027 family)